jgi:hypothetical protein
MPRLDAPGVAFPITGGHTPADCARYHLFHKASVRVERSPRLRKYREIIFADWSEGDDHLRWVIRGRVGEIAAWAKQIQEDSDG